MRGLKHYIGGLVLSATFLLASGAAQAMPIPQFDKLTNDQKTDYTGFMIRSAYDLLVSEGRAADAEKVIALFERKAGQGPSPHVAELVENVNGVRELNKQHANDPKYKPFEVDHAFVLTLKNNGIFVPVSKLLLVTQTYQPPAPSGALSAQTLTPPSPSSPGKK